MGLYIGDFHTDYQEKDGKEIRGEENAPAAERYNQSGQGSERAFMPLPLRNVLRRQ
jgi:major membrane immunogen (membrane-anchored lipoprotein)